MAAVIEVMKQEHKEGVGEISKKKYAMDILQVVVRDGADVFVGELMLPKGHVDCPPGRYSPEYGAKKSFDGKVTGQIVRLVPLKA